MTKTNNAVALEPQTETQQLGALLKRTNSDNPAPEDVAELRRELERLPDLWAVAGDLAKLALSDHLSKSYPNALTRECVTKGLAVLKKELRYGTAPALERILIDNVVLCHAKAYHAQLIHNSILTEGVSLDQGSYWERKLSSTQHRYLRACEALSRVRRLAQPAMQINIGDKQVNVTQSQQPSPAELRARLAVAKKAEEDKPAANA